MARLRGGVTAIWSTPVEVREVDLELKGLVRCSEMDWDPIFDTSCPPPVL